MSVLIIAEAGVNHNGDMGMAMELIDVAADAGADLVKFQTFSADRLVTPDAASADYQTQNTGVRETQHAMLKRLELSRDDHLQLRARCESRGIEFFSTGFDIESVDLLVELGTEYLKIPSGEITNLPFLRHVGSRGKRIVMSTGMANLTEVHEALSALEASGTDRSLITVLHCTTAYPTEMRDANLRAMVTLRDELDVAVGYSDHTLGTEAAVAAVALGAVVIEKHFTLDRTLSGPDHKASMEPAELRSLVAAIRDVEVALGDGAKQPVAAERANIEFARKSIVATRLIRAGETLSEDNVAARRPGSGLSPMLWDQVVGQSAPRDFQPNEMIEL